MATIKQKAFQMTQNSLRSTNFMSSVNLFQEDKILQEYKNDPFFKEKIDIMLRDYQKNYKGKQQIFQQDKTTVQNTFRNQKGVKSQEYVEMCERILFLLERK